MSLALFLTQPTCLHLSDTPSTPRKLDTKTLQLRSMRKMFHQPHHSKHSFADRLIAHGQDPEEPCTWAGVGCADERIVTSLVFDDIMWHVSVHWIPQTVHTMHFIDVVFAHNWSTGMLPRDLIYLCALNCSREVRVSPTLHLQRLPERMEELILQTKHLHGPLMLDRLPQNFRLLCIKVEYIEENFDVYMDYKVLPEGLRCVHISAREGFKHKIRVKSVHHAKRPAGNLRVEVTAGDSPDRSFLECAKQSSQHYQGTSEYMRIGKFRQCRSFDF